MSCVRMNTPKRSVSFIPIFLLPFTVASIIDHCWTSKCRVTSPFRTPDQPATCGLPGFDLSCDYPYNNPLLSFPSPGHNFSVDSIDYYLKVVKLSDPQGCLQKKLLGFDPSGTRFGFRHPAYFPLYNCSRSIDHLPSYLRGLEIGCLSGSDYSVLWDKYDSLSGYNGCEFIGDAMGPQDWTNHASLFSTAKSVYMSWELPAGCQRCGYGGCQRDPYDPRRLTCSASLPTPPNRSQSDTMKIVLSIITTPMILGLICYGICCKTQRSTSHSTIEGGHPRRVVTNNNMLQSHLDATFNATEQTLGLEQATLDVYPIMVVGESGRMLVNMEDKTCPICLSEYEPRETLRTLPECLHRFHVECIDEWLRAKALCPICRTPPPRRSS